MPTRNEGISAFSALIEITRDFAKITKMAHLDMAPPGRQSDPLLWQAAYHKDLQAALEGLNPEIWALAASLNLLPGSSATEWNALRPASPYLNRPGKDLVKYASELAREDDGCLRCRRANRPPTPRGA